MVDMYVFDLEEYLFCGEDLAEGLRQPCSNAAIKRWLCYGQGDQCS